MPGKDVTKGTSALLSRKRHVQDRRSQTKVTHPLGIRGSVLEIELRLARAVARSGPSVLIVRARRSSSRRAYAHTAHHPSAAFRSIEADVV